MAMDSPRERYPLELSDGTILNPGDWLEIRFPDRGRCTGKFSGVWRHPHWGLTFKLNWFREADGFGDFDVVTCLIEHSEEAVKAIDTARVIPRPGAVDAFRPDLPKIRPTLH